MHRKLLMLMLLACLSMFAYSQVKIDGEVRDAADGQPLSGATILIKGKTGGASTNAAGKFSITVPNNNAVLVISSLGFVSQEVKASSGAALTIQLRREESELKSVVVTALNIKKQKPSLGYAISELAAKDIAGYGETNPIQSLAGKMAGVSVTGNTAGPTGSTRITIRGVRELQGSNQPLFVIDGVPAVNGNIGFADQNGGFDLGDGLSDINPNDVESITVLKGASAAALYGSRALNGVVLITTKTGRGKKGLGIEFNSSVTIDKVNTKLDEVQKLYGQGNNGMVQRALNETNNITASWGPRYTEQEKDGILQRDGQIHPYKYLDNNVGDFFRNGVTVMNSVAVTGGNETSNLRASYSNVSSQDIIPKADFGRNTFMLRGETKLSDKLTVEAKGTLMSENVYNRPALTDDINNIGNGLLSIAPNFDQAWLQTYETAEGAYIDYTGNEYRANPYWTLNKTFNHSKKTRVSGSMAARYQFSERLSASINAGIDFFDFRFSNFYDKGTPSRAGGQLVENSIKTKEENYQAMINYLQPILQDLRVNFMAGANLMRWDQRQTVITGREITIPGKRLMSNFQDIQIENANPRKQINSVFGSAEFNFKDYLFLNFQARNDWASSLPKDSRSYFYPSVDLSWVLSKSLDITGNALNYAKIRTSFGKVGQDANPYVTDFYYRLTGRSYGGAPMGEVLGDVIPNGQLLPQMKTSVEIGTELGFLNDRINVDLTYYHEKTKDALLQLPIAQTSGYRFAFLNGADLENKGLELLLKTTPVRTGGFRWDLSFNFAKNWNKVLDLKENLKTYEVASARWAGGTINADEGKQFGDIRGLDFTYNKQGKMLIGADGTPVLTEKPVALGNIMPDWTGGITNVFSYKGFEFKAVIDIRVGGDMYSMSAMNYTSQGLDPRTLPGRDPWNEYSREVRAATDAGLPASSVDQKNRGYIAPGVLATDSVTANNKGVNPAVFWTKVANNTPRPFIYDGGFVKLRDVGINYSLPKKLYRNLPVQQITIGVVGRNLWIMSKSTPNIDPESNYNNGNGQGFEYGSLPGRKRFGFNLLIKL